MMVNVGFLHRAVLVCSEVNLKRPEKPLLLDATTTTFEQPP
jgi:hypothetical protein